MNYSARQYTLLLVDDNKLLVDSMVKTLPWESVGIGAVYSAYSGLEAMELLHQHTVDVLITDIRMPGITGLELIEQARIIQPGLQCVLLTGYAQFEYAKRAVELRAINYLVKPVKDKELLASVEEITVQLSRESTEEERANHALRLNLPLLRSELLMELLSNDRPLRHTLEEKLSMYKLPFAMGDRCQLVLLDPDSALERYSSGDQMLLEYSIMNIAEETLSSLCELWLARSKRRFIIMIVRPREAVDAGSAEFAASFQSIRDNVRQYLKSSLSVFVSKEIKFPLGLVEAYGQGMIQLQLRSGDPNGSFIRGDDRDASSHKTEALRTLHQAPSLIQLVETKNWSGLRDKIYSLFAELQTAGPHSRPHIIEAHMHLLSCFVSMAHGGGRLLEEMVGPYASDPSQPMRSLERLKKWTETVLGLLTQELHHERHEDVHAHIVNQVQRYVRDNLDKDISLNVIAEHVYLNPAYLSTIYRGKTGIKLSDFILQTRMEQANVLLKATTDKIYDIAKMVGYQSTQHFIREFKKYYGITPNKYRMLIK